jgi:hypothetical protein
MEDLFYIFIIILEMTRPNFIFKSGTFDHARMFGMFLNWVTINTLT